MYPWAPVLDQRCDGDEDEKIGPSVLHTYVPPKSPREALQPVIDKFRKSHYVMRQLMVEEDLNVQLHEENEYEDGVPEDSDDEDFKVWQAVMHLKDLFLECGWDVDAVEQTTFRRDEFLEKRRRYFLDVVKPLENSDAVTKICKIFWQPESRLMNAGST